MSTRQTLEDLLRNDDSDDEAPATAAAGSDASRISVDQILRGNGSGSDDDDLEGLIAAHRFAAVFLLPVLHMHNLA